MRHRALTRRGRGGNTSTEMALLISVLVVALCCAGYLFVPGFAQGVLGLGQDVETILATGEIQGGDAQRGQGGGAGAPSGGDGWDGLPDQDGGGGDGSADGGGEDPGDDGSASEDGGGDDSGSESGDDGGEDDGEDDEDEPECPYVYDEASGRWRDPETGQYVSGASASAAGC